MVALKRKVVRNRQKLTAMNELTVGMTYKNFTVLSQALGFPKPPEGNSRKAVMSALAEQYELSKDGRQITVVAKKEAVCAVKRGNNTKYADLLHEVLWRFGVINKEYSSPGTAYTFSRTRAEWQSILGLTTQEYRTFMSIKHHDEIVNALLESDPNARTNLYLFESETDRFLRKIVYNFFKSEKKNNMIRYGEDNMIVLSAVSSEKEDVKYSNSRYATDEEEYIIAITTQELLKKYHVTSVFKLGMRRRAFYEELNEKLLDQGINQHYKALGVRILNLPEQEPDLEVYRKEYEDLRTEIHKMIKTVLLKRVHMNYERHLAKAQKIYEARVARAIGNVSPKDIWYPPTDYIQKQTEYIEKYW